MLEIPERIWKAIPGFTKPQQVFRTNNDNVLCWKTIRREDKIPVVIKLFDWEVIEEYRAEVTAAEQLSKISHPHLVRILGIGEDDDIGIYYVMEYWGKDLRDKIQMKLDQQVVLGIIKQVLDGLTELHKHKMPHRDIKPENIFINNNGHVKLGDYGLVKPQRLIRTLSTIAGTRDYMAPEVFTGKYDRRCDIYSVGVVLRELLTWEQPPFTAEKAEGPGCDIINKAMAKEPKNRFQSAKEFLKALPEKTFPETITIIRPASKKKSVGQTKPVSNKLSLSNKIIQPDINWYTGISQKNKLPVHCPIANIYSCPRYYLSISLLTKEKIMSGIPAEQDKYLEEKWKQSPYYPSIPEEQPIIIFFGDDNINKFNMANHFCPEAACLVWHFFVSDIGKYADEIDINSAHRQLRQDGANPFDWRWEYGFIKPRHYTECKEYSFYASGKLQPVLTEEEDMRWRSRHLQELMNKDKKQPQVHPDILKYWPTSAGQPVELKEDQWWKPPAKEDIIDEAVKKMLTMSDHEKVRIKTQYFMEEKSRKEVKSQSPIFQNLEIQRYPSKPDMYGRDVPGTVVTTLQARFTELFKGGRDQNEAGNYKEILSVALELSRIAKRDFGDNNSRTADAYDRLAHIYLLSKEYRQAEIYYLLSLEITKKLYGFPSREVIGAFYNLARVYLAKSDYPAAEEKYKTIYEMAQKVWGKNAQIPEYAIVCNNYGGSLYLNKNYPESVNLYQEAINLNEQKYGKTHELLAINCHNLAIVYESQGQATMAIPFHQRARDIAQKTMKPDNPLFSKLT